MKRSDPLYFQKASPIETDNNWGLIFNNLKRIMKLMTSYAESLKLPMLSVKLPSATRIAQDKDEHEILYFARLILLIAVNCPKNSELIDVIQTLDASVQEHIVQDIQEVRQ